MSLIGGTSTGGVQEVSPRVSIETWRQNVLVSNTMRPARAAAAISCLEQSEHEHNKSHAAAVLEFWSFGVLEVRKGMGYLDLYFILT